MAAYWPAVVLAPMAVAAASIASRGGPRRSRSARRAVAGGLGAAALLGIVRWQLARYFSEKPAYEVERRLGDLEIRRYPKRVQAQTIVNEADWERALRHGFRRLADYIIGTSEKIAMTSPVTSLRGEGCQTVAFVMPRDRDLASLPVPEDPRVELREVPAHRVAALRWRGNYRAASTLAKEEELLALVRAAGLSPMGPPKFAGYDAPSTLPFLRRNETWVEIA